MPLRRSRIGSCSFSAPLIGKFLFLTRIVRVACCNPIASYEALKVFSEKPLDKRTEIVFDDGVIRTNSQE